MTHETPDELCTFEPDAASPTEPPDPVQLARLEAVMMTMNPKTRAIFLAWRIDNMSYEEIAQRTGLTIRRVEQEIVKALIHLDQEMSDPRPKPWWKRLWRRLRRR